MAWFSRNARTLGAVGVGIIAGTSVLVVKDQFLVSKEDATPHKQQTPSSIAPYISSALKLNKVLAAYTTNFEPATKWDSNWDR